jgi:putative transposase
MTTETTTGQEPGVVAGAVTDDQLIDRARGDGLQLTGEGGLLQQLTKRVLESALDGEITDHVGYDKHDPAGKGSGNTRNGSRTKTVLTDVGPVQVRVPRDAAGTFEPQIVRKRQRRLSGVDDLVLSLSAKGLTHGEISAHLAEIYGAEVSKQTISTITDKVMDGMAEWQNGPLDRVYPVVFIDAINVKIRDGQVANRPIYVVMAVTVDGHRDILGIWAGDGGEGAKHWLHVLTELKNRGVADVLMLVCDGLKGLPDAVATVWPRTKPRPNGSWSSPRPGARSSRRSLGCGRTPGPSLSRSSPSTWRSARSSAPRTRSRVSTPASGRPYAPVATSRPNKPR